MGRIAILGAGYVGVCTGIALSQQGHDVTLVDVVASKVAALRTGRVPFHEPGAPEALARAMADGRIRATLDARKALQGAEYVFLCVGTPRKTDGSPDLKHLRAAAQRIGRALVGRSGFLTVVVKSTVLPGTADDVVAPKLARVSGRVRGDGYEVVSNPEFLKEGSALADALQPDRIVIGAPTPDAANRIWMLYRSFTCPRVTVDCRTAEMIKYVANAFLATKVGLSNEMANLCERIGVDWYRVAEAIGHDVRIGRDFIRAGAGFGGSCLPKDLEALVRFSGKTHAPARILEETLKGNARQPLQVLRLLRAELGTLGGKRVALLGLSFKPNTDDVRETRALPIYRALRAAGAKVVCHDPLAGEAFRRLARGCVIAPTVRDALEGADAAVFQTEWAEYQAIPPSLFQGLMKTPVVIDARRTFDPDAMAGDEVRYRAIGLGTPRPPVQPPARASQRSAK